MIRSLFLLAAVLWANPVRAQSDEEGDASGQDSSGDDALSPYRTSLDELAERTIGTASKPVAFNWRRTHVHVAFTGSFPFELNNFNTLRGGGRVRFPTERMLVELGLSWAEVWDTPSSILLGETGYRQPGRPSRLDFDLALDYPLAEGVVTAYPKWFPAAELVFSACFELRYAIYPTGWGGMKPGEVLTAIISPTVTQKEIDNLDDARLQAMTVDPGRYGFLVGFSNDLYFEQGIFLTPKMMLAVPILAPANGTDLLMWADFSLSIGMAF